MNLNNALDGFSINRAALRASFSDSQNYWRELRQKECDAYAEYSKRAEGKNPHERVIILKDVANKYGFREEYLLAQFRV